MAFSNENDVTLTIKAKDEATPGITSALGSVGKLAGGFALGSIAVSGLTSAMGALKGVFTSSVAAFQQAEVANTRLTAILRQSTDASDAQIATLNAQAEALEKIGVVSADTIKTAEGTFATFDLQAASIQKLIPSFLDMVVAERGVNATTEDMISYANGLGQALQGNYQALSQRGFILDADTKKMIANGTETERINAIVEVLDSTYKGLNETMRKTSEGQLKAMQMELGKLQEDIGRGLVPVMANLTSSLMTAASGLLGTTDASMAAFTAFRALAEGGYAVINMFVQFASVTAQALNTVGRFVTAAAQSAVFFGGFSKDLDKGFEENGKTIQKFGDDVQFSFDEFVKKNEESAAALANSSKSNSASMSQMAALFANKLPGAEKKVKDLTDTYKKLGEAMTKVRQTAADDLDEISKSHDSNIKQSQDRITDLRKSLEELGNSYSHASDKASQAFAKEAKDDAKDIGEEIVKQQQKIADLRKQAGYETDPQKRILLEADLKKEEAAYAAQADFIKTMQVQVDEAKRRAALTEFDRLIEDYKNKRALAEQEYNDNRTYALAEFNAKSAEIRLEIKQEEKKIADFNTMFNTAQAAITKILAESEAMRLDLTKKNADQVIKLVDAQIDRYNRLADAIQRAASGKTAQVSAAASLPITREHGGIVPGPQGMPVPILAHGQEMVVPASQASSSGGASFSITINNPTVRSQDDLNAMRQMMEDAFRDVSRVHKLTTI